MQRLLQDGSQLIDESCKMINDVNKLIIADNLRETRASRGPIIPHCFVLSAEFIFFFLPPPPVKS